MKKILLLLAITLMSMSVMARKISNIERGSSWYYLYDENGKRYKTLSVSATGDIVGWSSTIFVVQTKSWIYVYDAEGKRIRTLSSAANGEVIAVAGDTFTTRTGSWIYTFNKDGKRIATRSVSSH